jgi:transglutaminase/protease-like cytokinesis protein 3
MMRLFFLSVLIFFAVSGLAQGTPYERVDSLMRCYKEKIKSADDLYKVVYYIRSNFQADSLRLRASIIWITENIAYDVKTYKKEDPSAAQLIYVIKNKRAICGGYASLVNFFCNSFNIECEIVNGYGRAGKNKIVMNQSYLRSNHAWNSIKINGTWRLVDATWAAGVVDDSDEDNLVYHKRFNETYYDTPPEKMILNHLPEQKQFQLTNKRMDQRKFMKAPLYTSEFLSHDISAVLPDTALIRTKKGDTVIFKLQTDLPFKSLSAFSDNLEKATYQGPTTYKDGWMEFRYPVRLIGFYNLFIGYYLNSQQKYILLAYKLEVK